MPQSEQIDQIAAALAKVQEKLRPIPLANQKPVEVSGVSKKGKEYSYVYHYAPLFTCFETCRPLLAANGLAVTQTLGELEGHPILETKLLHISGQWLSSIALLAVMEDTLDAGVQMSLFRRYSYNAILGLTEEERLTGEQAGKLRSQAGQPASQPAQDRPQSQGREKAPEKGQKPPQQATPEQVAKFVEICSPVWSRLPEDIQASLLKKYGNAKTLKAMPLPLWDKFLGELKEYADRIDGEAN